MSPLPAYNIQIVGPRSAAVAGLSRHWKLCLCKRKISQHSVKSQHHRVFATTGASIINTYQLPTSSCMVSLHRIVGPHPSRDLAWINTREAVKGIADVFEDCLRMNMHPERLNLMELMVISGTKRRATPPQDNLLSLVTTPFHSLNYKRTTPKFTSRSTWQ